MGVSPGAGVPKDYATIGGLSSLQAGKDKFITHENKQFRPAGGIFQRGIQTMIAAVVNLFGGALLGSWRRVAPEEIIIRDGQIALNGRTDLLAGVRGYCAAYQTKNINTGKIEPDKLFGWFKTWAPEERLLPFNGQLGPSKGAHIGDHGIVLDEEGLWTIYVLARRSAYRSIYAREQGLPASRLEVYVNDPDGNEYANRSYRLPSFGVTNNMNEDRLEFYADTDYSVSICVPVVVPGPGYKVAIGVYDSRKTWWKGGTKFATLAVIKHDNRVENLGQETVPDE